MPAAGKCRKGVFRMKKLLLVMLVPVLVLGVIACGGFETDTEVDAYIQGFWTGADAATVFSANTGIDLFITPNEMTARYEVLGKVESVPFNIQFNRVGGKASRFIQFAVDGSDPVVYSTNVEDLSIYTDVSKATVIDFLKIDGVGFAADYDFAGFAGADADAIALAKATFFDVLVEDILVAAGTVEAGSFLIGGTLLVSDYRSGSELATVGVLILTQHENNIEAEQAFIITSIKFAEDVPWYMLSLPFKVGLYTQNI